MLHVCHTGTTHQYQVGSLIRCFIWNFDITHTQIRHAKLCPNFLIFVWLSSTRVVNICLHLAGNTQALFGSILKKITFHPFITNPCRCHFWPQGGSIYTFSWICLDTSIIFLLTEIIDIVIPLYDNVACLLSQMDNCTENVIKRSFINKKFDEQCLQGIVWLYVWQCFKDIVHLYHKQNKQLVRSLHACVCVTVCVHVALFVYRCKHADIHIEYMYV